MRYEYVKSMRLAGLLMQQGFKIYAVQKDKFNPAYDVYFFIENPERSWIRFSIDQSKIFSKSFPDGIPYDFGELRKISKAS